MFSLLIALLLTCIAGAISLYWLWTPATMAGVVRWFENAKRAFKIATRYTLELGGYIHDTHMSFFIPPAMGNRVTGTWADAAGAVTSTIARKCSLGDNTATITYPIGPIPTNSVANKGFYLTSIDWWFEFETAAPTAMDATINSVALSADTAVLVVSSVAFSYDTGHDSAGERDNVDQHKMTLSLTTPIWIDNDQLIQVTMVIDGAANTVVYDHGIRVNGTLRL